MVRPVEQTKVCARCKKRKVWSAFHAKRKWPDGSTRCTQSECKECRLAYNREWFAKQPVEWRRARKRKTDARRRRDPERQAAHRDYQREWTRRKNGTMPENYRTSKLMVGTDGRAKSPPAAPFAEWLRYVVARDETNIISAANHLGLNEKTMRDIINGKQATVRLELVERALIADGTHLREIYPDWYEVAA